MEKTQILRLVGQSAQKDIFSVQAIYTDCGNWDKCEQPSFWFVVPTGYRIVIEQEADGSIAVWRERITTDAPVEKL